MTERPGREQVVDYLQSRWLGPTGGAEEHLDRSPIYAYLVGTLFPIEAGAGPTSPAGLDEETEAESAVSAFVDPEDSRAAGFTADDLEEDTGLSLTGAFGWAPQSL
jgi:hypothetical protein